MLIADWTARVLEVGTRSIKAEDLKLASSESALRKPFLSMTVGHRSFRSFDFLKSRYEQLDTSKVTLPDPQVKFPRAAT